MRPWLPKGWIGGFSSNWICVHLRNRRFPLLGLRFPLPADKLRLQTFLDIHPFVQHSDHLNFVDRFIYSIEDQM